MKGLMKKQNTLAEIDYPMDPPTKEQLRKRLSEGDYPLDPFELSELGLPGQAQVGNGGVQQQVGQGARNVQQQVGGGNQAQGFLGASGMFPGLLSFPKTAGQAQIGNGGVQQQVGGGAKNVQQQVGGGNQAQLGSEFDFGGQAQAGNGGVQQQVGHGAGNVGQQVGGGNQFQGQAGIPKLGGLMNFGSASVPAGFGQAQVGGGGVKQQVGANAGNVQQQVGGGNQVQGSLGIPHPPKLRIPRTPIKGIPFANTGLIHPKSGQAQVGNGGVQQQVGANAGNVQQQVGGGNQKQLGK